MSLIYFVEEVRRKKEGNAASIASSRIKRGDCRIDGAYD